MNAPCLQLSVCIFVIRTDLVQMKRAKCEVCRIKRFFLMEAPRRAYKRNIILNSTTTLLLKVLT